MTIKYFARVHGKYVYYGTVYKEAGLFMFSGLTTNNENLFDLTLRHFNIHAPEKNIFDTEREARLYVITDLFENYK